MINLTRLLGADNLPSDANRYGRGHGSPKSAAERRPVVVWNITRRCNLRCVHCYSDSDNQIYPGELTWYEMKAVVDDLADYGVPVLLLSGGEPTMHPRFFDLSEYARSKGLKLTLSTNGTRINAPVARRLKELGFGYVGISLDGIGEVHDHFRGKTGCYDKVIRAIRACVAEGQKVGLRLTLTQHTIDQINPLLDLVELEKIDRICFYHLVYSGRGSDLGAVPVSETRKALDQIIARAEKWLRDGLQKELLTVAQPADGPYLLMKLRERGDTCSLAAAEEAGKLMQWNGGGSFASGTGIGNIDSIGNVHPDQFWQDITLGNVRVQPFSEIWGKATHPLLDQLRSRNERLQGRCAECQWKDLCGGGFRVRALQKSGNLWAEDPGCYLRQSEVLPSHAAAQVA